MFSYKKFAEIFGTFQYSSRIIQFDKTLLKIFSRGGRSSRPGERFELKVEKVANGKE